MTPLRRYFFADTPQKTRNALTLKKIGRGKSMTIFYHFTESKCFSTKNAYFFSFFLATMRWIFIP